MNSRDRLRADIEDHAVGGNGIEAVGMGRRIGREMSGDDGIDRQDDGAIGGFRLVDDSQRGGREIFFRQ
jgi:hypothetical protein